MRYDIFGKDILIANKMESNGVEGKVAVSEATKILLEKDTETPFIFEKHKDVECKNMKKPVPSYLISEIKEEVEIEQNNSEGSLKSNEDHQ